MCEVTKVKWPSGPHEAANFHLMHFEVNCKVLIWYQKLVPLTRIVVYTVLYNLTVTYL